MTISELEVSLRAASHDPSIRAALLQGKWHVYLVDLENHHLHGRGQDESLAVAMGMALEGFRARVAVRSAQEMDEQERTAGRFDVGGEI